MNNKNYLVCCLLWLATLTSALDSSLQNNVTLNRSSTQILAEGGALPQNSELLEDKTHLSREHVTIANKNTTTKVKDTSTVHSVNATSINEISNKTDGNAKDNGKPAQVVEKLMEIDAGVPKKNNEKQSVGKKGVSFSDVNSTEEVSLKGTTPAMNITSGLPATTLKPTSAQTPVPKKPIITVGSNEANTETEVKKPEPDLKTPNIDPALLEKNSQRTNYVIPIVAVILSVPLVAIIISAVYKRGQDWWQHRNYRRMDFLIEGMYNN